VTLGTGLGSAFLEDGKIVDTGPRVPFEGSLHLVPYRGRPAEETVSRAALLASYGDPRLDVRDVAVRARNGDPRARRVFDELASALGEITAPWLDSFGASCLVVGGSISQAWDLLGRGLRDALADVDGLEEIVRAERVDHAALLGAARHAAATAPRGTHVGARR
jgi:glucokinase